MITKSTSNELEAPRHQFMVNLVTSNDDFPPTTSRAEPIAKLQSSANQAKEQFLCKLPELKVVDPEIQVVPQMDSIFSVIFITTTNLVIQQIAADHLVKSISLVTNNRL